MIPRMQVATHNGSFHADEVFAIAALGLLPEELEVVRTRDPDSSPPRIFESTSASGTSRRPATSTTISASSTWSATTASASPPSA